MVWGVVPDVKLGVGTDDDDDDVPLLVSSMYVESDVVDTVGLIDDNGIAGDEEGAVTEVDDKVGDKVGDKVDDTPVADDEGE